jgi:hypothetical protein
MIDITNMENVDLEIYAGHKRKYEKEKSSLDLIQRYIDIRRGMTKGSDNVREHISELRSIADVLLELPLSERVKAYAYFVSEKYDSIKKENFEASAVYRDIQRELKDRLDPFYYDEELRTSIIDFYESNGLTEVEAEKDLEQSLAGGMIANKSELKKLGEKETTFLPLFQYMVWVKECPNAKGYSAYIKKRDNWPLKKLKIESRRRLR